MPDDDCCTSCLCAGATLDDAVQLAGIGGGVPESPHLWNATQRDGNIACAAGNVRATSVQRPQRSARDALIAAHVWLI